MAARYFLGLFLSLLSLLEASWLRFLPACLALFVTAFHSGAQGAWIGDRIAVSSSCWRRRVIRFPEGPESGLCGLCSELAGVDWRGRLTLTAVRAAWTPWCLVEEKGKAPVAGGRVICSLPSWRLVCLRPAGNGYRQLRSTNSWTIYSQRTRVWTGLDVCGHLPNREGFRGFYTLGLAPLDFRTVPWKTFPFLKDVTCLLPPYVSLPPTFIPSCCLV